MFVDALSVVRDILIDQGWSNVHPDPADQTERLSSEALAGEDYVWLEEDQGTTPHVLYADRPAIRVILYSSDQALHKARQIQYGLAVACVSGKAYPSGGLHRMVTVIHPSRQDISGIPPGVVRVSALYELVLSTQQKWV